MNQKANQYFSKVEKHYDVKVKRVTKCPITGQEGQPTPGNPLVWYVAYKGKKGELRTSRWSYSTGRAVSPSAEDTNVL
jgi:hypothetical protein